MALPKLKDIQWVTTDCYGTLIDWEKGITDAFKAEAKRDGISFEAAKDETRTMRLPEIHWIRSTSWTPR